MFCVSFIGRYFYEGTVTDEGLCRLGWSTGKATLDLGTDRFGYGFGGTGKKSYGKQFDSYGQVYIILFNVCYHSIDFQTKSYFKKKL